MKIIQSRKMWLFMCLLIMPASITIAGVSIKILPTTDKTAEFPLCYNNEGEILPCASDVIIPTPDDPYSGYWSGRVIYDRHYSGENTCYDADIRLRIEPNDNYGEISSVTITRDSGGFDVQVFNYTDLSSDGYVADTMNYFGILTDFVFQFNSHGGAEGLWSDIAYSDCNGALTITKE